MRMAGKPATGRESIWQTNMAGIRDSACSGDDIKARIHYRNMHGNDMLFHSYQTDIDILQWALLQNVRKTMTWIRGLVESDRHGTKPILKRGLPF